MKYCLLKQDTYQDLYIANNDISCSEILFSSMMRTGPFGLIHNLGADFFIIKEEPSEECQKYKNFLGGFGENYHLLKSQLLNTIPGNQFFEPGSDKPHEFYSVSCYDISWDNYDIIISINFSIPSSLIKQYPNTLWCYLIGENNLDLLDNPKYGYDIALSQDIDVSYNVTNNVVQFPYTFLEKNTLFDIMKNYHIGGIGISPTSNGIFIEVNSCRGRPVTSYPDNYNKLKTDLNLVINTHEQNIKKNLIKLINSKYFIKYGGRSIRGNSVIEAISCSCLVLMDSTQIGYGFLIPEICDIKNEQQIYDKVKYFEENKDKYNETLELQKNLLQKYIYEKPYHNLERLFYEKNNYCIAFVSDINYFSKFINTLTQLVNVGKYYGPIILLASNDLYNSKHINHELILKYNVKIYNFPNIETLLSEKTVNYIKKRTSGKKTFRWIFNTFNKFNLFQESLKKYKYILYLDTGIKVYKPIHNFFSLLKENKILAHQDDYPRYYYKLFEKFYNEEPYITDLNSKFDLETKEYFQTTIMFYDTSIINKNTLNDICQLVEKYPISCNGDQEYISLYFDQVTNQMNQIKKNDGDNYYYDYYQRWGVGKYIISKI